MKLCSKLRKAGALALALTFVCGGAFAAERAVMQSPAKNAAYVVALPGMVNNLEMTSFLGTTHTASDGIVIRQSRIENGKIIIPPGGLYVTSRSGNWEPFRGKPFTIAGKEYVVINHNYERSVVKNVTFKLNQIIPLDMNKTRGMELTKIEAKPYDMPGQGSATFKLVKSTGNYYGTEIPAYVGDMITNIAAKNLAAGPGEPEGITPITAKNKLGEHIYANSFGSVGRTYVVLESITADEVKVKEMATDNSTNLYASSSAPQVREAGKGDSIALGAVTVDILDIGKDTLKIRMTDSSGSIEKVLGPYNEKNMKWVPMSPPACDLFWVLSKNGKAALHLNVFKDGGPFGSGKASLVLYNDVLDIRNSSVWAADPRYLATAET